MTAFKVVGKAEVLFLHAIYTVQDGLVLFLEIFFYD